MFLLLLLPVFFLADGARPFQKAMCIFDNLEQKRTIFFVDGRVFLNYYKLTMKSILQDTPISVASDMRLPQGPCSHSFQC